jgi:hypothetical protein
MSHQHHFQTFYECWSTDATARQCINLMKGCIGDNDDLKVWEDIISRCSKYTDYNTRNGCYLNSVKTWEFLKK